MAKRFRVLIHDEAVDELDHIARVIASDKPMAAQVFLRALSKKIMGLETFPFRGARVKILESSAKEEIRFLEYRSYLIFYTVQMSSVLVLHVAVPGQNWMALLQ